MKCPSCGAEAGGNFCSACGTPLKQVKCRSCGASAAYGLKFCTRCGAQNPDRASSEKTPPGAAPSGRPTAAGAGEPTTGGGAGSGRLAWWVAGAMMVVVLVVLGYPVLSGNSRPGVPGGGGGAPPGMGGTEGGSSTVDLTTMSLEEQGTILFNRVMTSSSAGDSADVEFFLPKALVIHEQLAPTDPDGLYHFALLYLVGGDFEGALGKAREGLEEVPDYLLLLAAGAEALVGLGDRENARELYSHFVEVYDAEMVLMRPGYEHHQQILPIYLEEARAFLEQG